MKAIRFHNIGGPEVLQIDEVPDPTPAAGQVLVRVMAIGINPYETYIRSGKYPSPPTMPAVLGNDAAGVIERVGDGVTTWKPGDRVYTAQCLTGAYAEMTVCDAKHVHPLPAHVSFAQGAALNVPYATAYRALFHRAQVKPAEWVLIHGASGGVGIACVQFAAAHGCRVIGTAGTDRGLELVQREGAMHVFNHRDKNYVEKIQLLTGGVSAIIEMLANVNLDNDLSLLAKFGRVVVVGNRGRIEIDARQTMAKESAILGMQLWAAGEPALLEAHAAIVAGLNAKTLRPIVGTELPLLQAAEAHRRIMDDAAHGKIVLVT
jgi:NADPH2:quinone reductase